MKIELLTYSADRLEALSDSELEAILKPYFPLTRPEEQKKSDSPKQLSMAKVLTTMTPEAMIKRQKGLAIARALGIKI